MKKLHFSLIVLAIISIVGLSFIVSDNNTRAQAPVTDNSSCLDPNYTAQLNPIYRKWNNILIDHFYTYSSSENANGYAEEQSTWKVVASEVTGTIPLYRYYSAALSDHFYSTSAVTPKDYVSEGLLGFVFAQQVPGSIPLYRLYHHVPGNPANGDHLYTISTAERDSAAAIGYNPEGIEAYICGI